MSASALYRLRLDLRVDRAALRLLKEIHFEADPGGLVWATAEEAMLVVVDRMAIVSDRIASLEKRRPRRWKSAA